MADYLKAAPVTMNLASAALVAGTTNTLTSTVSTSCVIDGKFAVTKGAMTNSSFGTQSITTDANGAAFVPIVGTATTGSAATVVFGINAAGAVKVLQGPQTPCDLGAVAAPGAFRLAPQFPAIPDDFCPIAYTIARTSPSVPSVVIGTANWANNFTTFQNIATLPALPQVA
jgi:hypothetical protein